MRQSNKVSTVQRSSAAATGGPFGRRCSLTAVARSTALTALSLLATIAIAEPPTRPPDQQTATELNTITVEAPRDRATIERRVNTFVSGITTAPYLQSLARWQKEIPICPQVAGLPYDDGEYVLSRLSQIAAAAGASLAPEICQPNLRIIVSSVPDELIAAWYKREPWMFDDANGAKIRQFLHASTPVRVWYKTAYFNWDGRPCLLNQGLPVCTQDANVRLAALRDLSSVIVLIDARRTKDITMGQLAAYVAMVGLAEIRVNAKIGDALTILRLFTDPANAPTLGMSTWDEAYLKALYHTQHEDKTQLLAVKASMLNDVAPDERTVTLKGRP
jgi:hypothetical protein